MIGELDPKIMFGEFFDWPSILPSSGEDPKQLLHRGQMNREGLSRQFERLLLVCLKLLLQVLRLLLLLLVPSSYLLLILEANSHFLKGYIIELYLLTNESK